VALSGKIWEWTWLDNCWTPISLNLAFEGPEKHQNLQLSCRKEVDLLDNNPESAEPFSSGPAVSVAYGLDCSRPICSDC